MLNFIRNVFSPSLRQLRQCIYGVVRSSLAFQLHSLNGVDLLHYHFGNFCDH